MSDDTTVGTTALRRDGGGKRLGGAGESTREGWGGRGAVAAINIYRCVCVRERERKIGMRWEWK